MLTLLLNRNRDRRRQISANQSSDTFGEASTLKPNEIAQWIRRCDADIARLAERRRFFADEMDRLRASPQRTATDQAAWGARE